MPRTAARISLALAVVAVAAVVASAPAQADTVWLCKPGVDPNPCVFDMKTTIYEPSGGSRVADPAVPANPPVDCFYVYPTVSNDPAANSDRSKDPELYSIAKYQAARFSTVCRVFAPVYRQRTLAALSSGRVTGEDPDWYRIAYADVRAAWQEYLVRENGGRGVVLLGHSQGTHMLRRLVREQIDGNASVRRRLVGGVLLGGDVTVRAGRPTGGDFHNVPVCTRFGQFGCIVAYSTFATDPPSNSRYGTSESPSGPNDLPGGPGYEVACTDPSVLSGTEPRLRALQPTEPFAPGPILAGIVITYRGAPPTATTPWVVPRDRFRGGCRTINGAHVLRYDPEPGSRRPMYFPDRTWGTHLVDMNLGQEKLVRIVELQSRRYLRPHVRLTRRCVARGQLRVGLAGDESAIDRVRFAFGRRTVARDGRAPFTRVVSVRGARRGRLRAVVAMKAGAQARVVRSRSLPRCGAARRGAAVGLTG